MLRCLTICCVTAVFTVLHCKDVFALLIMSLVQPNKKEYNRILHSSPAFNEQYNPFMYFSTTW